MNRSMNPPATGIAIWQYAGLTPVLSNLKSVILSMALGALVWAPPPISAQNNPCGFDDNLEQLISDYPQVVQIMNSNESMIHDMMENNPQAIMNHDIYTIPVVFHVVHLGEPEGLGSNISETQLLQGIDDLNYYFRDQAGLGNDVEINFCLAKRDPAGNLSTGINRVNGYGTGNYENIGIATGVNETAIKALSIWPNTDYLNIWVVHYIAGSPGDTILGNAYFAGAPPAVDGITMRYDAIGTAGNSAVIAHEAGHFLNLYHTFQSATTTSCPPNPNNNCQLDGDRVCDTPPHVKIQGGCNSSGTNSCDNGSSNALFVHNYMSYSDNSCLHEFTMGQVERMRGTLLVLRSSLTTSLGCEPGCTTTIADFEVDSVEISAGSALFFKNTSSSNTDSSVWRIDGHEISTNYNLSYLFVNGGIYEVCLDAFGPNCVNRHCTTITVYPVCVSNTDTCEAVLNGNFEQITSGAPSGYGDNFAVCYWETTFSSPFYCNKPDNNSIGLYTMPFDAERMTSEFPLTLDTNSACIISFDFLVTNSDLASIIISLTETNDFGPLPNTATIIARIDTPAVDYQDLGVSFNHMCYPDGAVFHHFSAPFTYNGDGQLFLNVSGIPFQKPHADEDNPSIFFIDNLSINCCACMECCAPEPAFDYDLDDCSVTFTGTNTGDAGSFYWDFGDGSTDTTGATTVTHDYIFGGTFTVCLTVTCPDLETTVTVCEEIIIPDTCNVCNVLEPLTATLCEESGDSTDTYLSNFTFKVPKGYYPCKTNNLHVNSPEVAITVTSFATDTSNTGYNEISVALLITPPAGYNFDSLGAAGYLTLCSDTSGMICREFLILPQVCDYCRDEIHLEASCADSDPNDDVYIYEGSVTVTVPLGSDSCGVFSPLSGFAATFEQDTSNWTINFQITTHDKNLMHATALLCFYNEQLEIRTCIPLDITLLPCDVPTECVAEWSLKNMTCTGEEDGNYIFNISKSVYAGPYELCGGGLFASVDGGGTVSINPTGNNSVVLNVFTFNIDILIPIDSFVDGQVYNLRLYLCDHLGNIVCYYFPLRLYCDLHDSGSGARSWGKIRFDGEAKSGYTILPNPARNKMMIVAKDFDREKQQEVLLMDQFGRTIIKRRLSTTVEEINVAEQLPGVYVVAIQEAGILVKIEKIVIIQ